MRTQVLTQALGQFIQDDHDLSQISYGQVSHIWWLNILKHKNYILRPASLDSCTSPLDTNVLTSPAETSCGLCPVVVSIEI